ncbi:MAG: hypothetical protein WCI48_06185, partial [Bacteroidota bacterium]
MNEIVINTSSPLHWENLVADPRVAEGKALLERAVAYIHQDMLRSVFPGLTGAALEISFILLCEMDQDAETMVAVILKDILDKGAITLQQVRADFNPAVEGL